LKHWNLLLHDCLPLLALAVGMLFTFSARALPAEGSLTTAEGPFSSAEGPLFTADGALSTDEVPELLRPWVGWVLHGEEERVCPFHYDDATARHCAWPEPLQLELTDEGGQFIQLWQLYTDSWIRLPGSSRYWPQQVSADGAPARLLERDGRPMLRLAPGRHTISGLFKWQQLPESLDIAPETGLLLLKLNGAPVALPERGADGVLWLRKHPETGERQEAPAERLVLQVYRRIIDEIPQKVVTRMELDVSGRPREVVLGGALLERQIPLALDSPLPARLEADGRLRLQVRPGSWSLTLTSRHSGPVTALALGQSQPPWPEDEVWVFDARRQLRLVEVSGLVAVDPRQTRLPADWQALPAYRIAPGQALRLTQIRRGEAEPEADHLSLQREMWLDFDGRGYTLKDQIAGTMNRGWRLDAGPQLILGRVAVDGRDQLITRLPDPPRQGVEIRRGAIRVQADSRYPAGALALPAVGWDLDVQQLHTTLHLPPGWKLLAAGGMDNQPQTWLQRWTLLDLFVVLITALAVGRLWGWRWTPLALLTLALIWHEPGYPPRLVWLNILAALALLRVLPSGRMFRLVAWYRNLSLLALVLIAVPFMIEQVRIGLFPQLGGGAPMPVELIRTSMVQDEAQYDALPSAPAERLSKSLEQQAYPAPGVGRLQQPPRIDPDAKVQTGPGLPRWHWQSVQLSWNGPVPREQSMQLVLLSPRVNLMLSGLRVLLVITLALLLAGLEYRRMGVGKATRLVLLLIGLPLVSLAPDHAAAASGAASVQTEPSAQLLQTLKQRLLAPPDCLPGCAMSPRMQLTLTSTNLTLQLEYHVQARSAVPLPAQASQWLPDYVSIDGVSINGGAGGGLRQVRDGSLWVVLEPGIHQLLLRGPVPARTHFQLPLPLKPHRIDIHAKGWQVEGVHEDGVADDQLQLTRQPGAAAATQPEPLAPSSLPPFVRIERTLRLGLDWYLDTRVIRVAPRGSAIVLALPLLEGEAVLSEGIRTENGQVLVNMAAGQQQIGWHSSLAKRERLQLVAADTTSWVELWRADIDPVWHLETEGIPPIGHTDSQGRRLPQWQPWPGEQLSLQISRPPAVTGRTLTIDSSELQLTPGRRVTEASLQLTLRSSQADRHTLMLPPRAELQSVLINEVAQPLRSEGRKLILPISPGEQHVTVNWLSSEGIGSWLRTPPVDLGAPGVNSELRLMLGRDRWILLLGGPSLGPAVWFWGELIILLLLALGLARVRLTPLKSWHWLLLLIGLSQVPIAMGALVVGWLLLLGARGRLVREPGNGVFNGMQVGLVLLTLVALGCLFLAIQQGLLGWPEMQIAGNQSGGHRLNWYQDRSDGALPRAWVLSVPLLVYRLLMLAWALWLAFSLLGWLRWGWDCFSKGGSWRRLPWPKEIDARKSAKKTPDTR